MLQKKKCSRPTTVIQPFSFDDEIDVKFQDLFTSPLHLAKKSLLQYTKSKIKPIKAFDPPSAMHLLNKNSASTPNLSSGLTEAVLASTGNTASELRRQHNKNKAETFSKEELVERRKLLQTEMRQQELRENNPAWRKLRHEVVNYDEIEAKKLQRLREAEDMAREYKMSLEKMMVRVQNQPTLFERQSAVRAFDCSIDKWQFHKFSNLSF